MSSINAVRIVTCDFYMAAPIPELDVLYSEFRGSSISKLPIIRVFGSTNTGQKICLHIHGVFPYLYIPYDGTGNPNALIYQIAANLDRAINISLGQTSSTTQHIYKICLVSGIPFYGYHRRKHQFFKIYFYNPIFIRKVSNLLQNEQILGKIYQPHESHINYILQFMIDYNLHGMNNINLSEIKFRLNHDKSENIEPNLPPHIVKMSSCELEGDILCENILNRLEVASGKLAVNPGIAALWEDEKQRRRNKNEESVIGPGLTLIDNNVPPTDTHFHFEKLLNDRLTILESEIEKNDLNLSVYPAESPNDKELLDASTVEFNIPESQTSFDSSNLDSTILSLDTTLDEEGKHLYKILQDLEQKDNDDFKEDSILSQIINQHDEIEDFDLSLPLEMLATPMKFNMNDKNEEESSDDSLNKTLVVPQIDGTIIDSSSDEDTKKGINDKINYLNSGKYCALPIYSTNKKKSEKKVILKNNQMNNNEKVKRILSFNETDDVKCNYKRRKRKLSEEIEEIKENKCSILQDENYQSELNDLTIAELYDLEKNFKAVEGSSTNIPSKSLNSDSTSISDSIPPYQLEKVIKENEYVELKEKPEKNEDSESDNRLDLTLSNELLGPNKNCLIKSQKKPPTKRDVEDSLMELNIPKIIHEVPYYSDFNDVTGPVEVGFSILKISSKSSIHCTDFKSIFPGLDDYRKEFLSTTNTKLTKEILNNYKLSYCKNGDCLITPIKKPPSRKIVLKWKQIKNIEGKTKIDTTKYEKTRIMLPTSPGGQSNNDSDNDLDLTTVVSSLESEIKSDNSGQITGVTLDKTFDFKMLSQNYQEAKALNLNQSITLVVMELHIATRGDLKPNPEYDSIRAIFYSILNDNRCKQSGIIAVNYLSNSHDLITNIIKGSGIDCDVVLVDNEINLLGKFIEFINEWDPDIIAGYEIEMLSWGYLVDRARMLGINLSQQLSRIKDEKITQNDFDYGDSTMKIVGRIVINVWRLMRHEIALQSYTFENIFYHILHQRIPKYSFKDLTIWWDHKSSIYRYRTANYYLLRVEGILRILDQLDFIGRTSELARLFGIQFYEVLSRGSQFRVESMMLRLAKPLNYIAVSPSVQQRAHMRAPECLPLILEPESKLYVDPVIVLDFQSLYPSIIIAYNYCFSTCIGKVERLGTDKIFEFGATQYKISKKYVRKLLDKKYLNFSPSGVAFVKSKIRDGILPRMLREILDTRLMVKNSMKENKENKILQKVLHNRQLGLKLIANVTFGYTAANFSGRMPAVELGDTIVSKARETLQRAINLVENNKKWGARVVYGDTDSLFVLVPNRTKLEAFEIGKQIAKAVTDDNPNPIKLKLEKVYHPCILQTKKRYVGYMYENPEQIEPIYDAKGIETVRRDGCPAVSKMLEKCIRMLFETKNISLIRKYVLRQFFKIITGRISLQDLTFAKEYRGASGYRPGACVPALELSKKWKVIDKRNEPRSGERVPYIIAHGPPGLPLIKLVKSPHDFLNDPTLRPNAIYYITKVIIPPINRCFNLIGADLNVWFNQMPRKQINYLPNSSPMKKSTIEQYFITTNCVSCGQRTQNNLCNTCEEQSQATTVKLNEKIRNWERNYYDLKLICESCTGICNSTNCLSLDCPVLYRLTQCSRDIQQCDFIRQIMNSF